MVQKKLVLAKFIGGIFSAVSWILYMYAYVILKARVVFEGDTLIEFITYSFFIVIPLVIFITLIQMDIVESMDTRDKKQRMLMAATFVLTGLMLMGISYAMGYEQLGKLVVVFVVPSIIIGTVNKFWLMSMHTASTAVSVTSMAYLSGPLFYPLYLAVVLVAWSRVYEKKHTVEQVLAGGTMGVLVGIIILSLLFERNIFV